jgi:SMI1/KNR4 family protein SUKH-1
VDETILEQTLLKLDFQLPGDYLEFMRKSNGGEGFVGNNKYVSLWSIEDLIDWNSKYNVDLYAPGYFIFASDGGGTAYAFEKKGGAIATFQFIGMLMADEPIILGTDLTNFLDYLLRNQDSL